MRQLGLDAGRPPAAPALAAANGHADGAERAAKKARLGAGVASPAGGRLPTALVLDIEGTIAGISYVTDVLFPYAAQRLRCGPSAPAPPTPACLVPLRMLVVPLLLIGLPAAPAGQ
jgi:hypothetical protein